MRNMGYLHKFKFRKKINAVDGEVKKEIAKTILKALPNNVLLNFVWNMKETLIENFEEKR